MNGLRKIPIVCTCRGPADLEPWRVGFIDEVMSRAPMGAGCEMTRDENRVGTGYRLRCGRCPRAPKVTFGQWAWLVAGLDAADAPRLDIAALPF